MAELYASMFGLLRTDSSGKQSAVHLQVLHDAGYVNH